MIETSDPASAFAGMPAFRYPGLTSTQAATLTRFARCLRDANQRVNLTRIVDPEAVYLRHFADALEAWPLLDGPPEGGRLLDVGSGPGVPGLVLACAAPAWQVTSLEATGKKARFQEVLTTELGLENARVLQGRAETLAHDASHRGRYALVTCRALAGLPIALELTVPFLEEGGRLLTFLGSDAADRLGAAQGALSLLQARVEQRHPYTLADLAKKIGQVGPAEPGSLCLAVIRKEGPTPARYPRAYGLIRRRPL